MTSVTVVGSINVDLIFTAARLPAPGETIGGAQFAIAPGGKGANQALAARRMGADVSLVGRVGDDAWADLALELLIADGVDLRVDRIRGETTGMAMIVVGADAENQIVVAPGANWSFDSGSLVVPPADVLLCQLEIPTEAVRAAIKQFDGTVILNAAPAEPFQTELLHGVDVLIVNESEHRALESEIDCYDGMIVTTIGADGAVAVREDETVARAEPPRVSPIDTVGAGDAFCGALAVVLGAGEGIQVALETAVTAGALATTSPGAQPSLPGLNDVRGR